MSEIRGQLFFAPEIPFSEVDWNGGRLPNQFYQRMSGFYLMPAIALAKNHHTFASGILAVCAVDSLGLLMTGSNSSSRITALCRKIPDFADDTVAKAFVDHFRNGLVHQARIKRASQFSADIDRTAVWLEGRLIVNPLFLARDVTRLLDEYIADVNKDLAIKAAFRKRLKTTFRHERARLKR